MTGTQLAALVGKYTGTTSVTYTDATLLVDANNTKDELSNHIIKRNEQLFIIPATFDLVASSVTAREYSFPNDILNQLVTVELALDTSQSTVFIPCLPFPGGMQRLLRQIDGITEAKITANFTNNRPYYVIQRNSIYILSGTISALSAGGKIRYRLYPADLANLTGTSELNIDPTTSSFGIPKSFHELWARRVSIIFKSSKQKPIPLSPLEKNYENDLENALNSISESDLGEEIRGFLPSSDSPSVLGSSV